MRIAIEEGTHSPWVSRVLEQECGHEVLWLALGPILEMIGSLTKRIGEYDRKLKMICQEHYAETELLRQVEGVGVLSALTFVLTLEDPHRFERSRTVGAYLRLVAARDHSGDRDPQGEAA